MGGDNGHPLPNSGEARHNEIPEGLEEAKGRGQDPAEVATPHPDAVAPDGEPYGYDDLGRGPPTDRGVDERPAVERVEPEPGP